MKKREREALRVRAEARQQNARQAEREARQEKKQKEDAGRKALATHVARWDARQTQLLDAGPRDFVSRLMSGPGRRLVSYQTREALVRLGRAPHQRSLADWQPSGKGRDTVFRSLCEHLLAKYPTPRFLWSVFDERVEQNAALFMPMVIHVAAGGSLFQFCKEGRLPFSLTRAQCLEFTRTPPEMSIASAVRRVQVKAEGGSLALFEVWRNLERMKVFGTKDEEDFKLTVLRFFARNPMLNRAQIGPLCDYIFNKRRQNAAFSMQGRTVAALTRDMNEWHDELNRARGARRLLWSKTQDAAPVKFERSGFQSFRTEKPVGKATRSGFTNVVVWTIQEILSSDALREEGQTLHHCVYSYRADVAAKETSIWSLSAKEDQKAPQKLITLEVNNRLQSVVQARGACNRLTRPEEDRLIAEWASRNSLAMTYGRGW